MCWECEFDFLRRTLIVDIKLVLTHFDFHFSAIFITLRPNCDMLMQILYKKIF